MLARRSTIADLAHWLPVLGLALLTACGGGSKTPATQVAAKVNDTEITVHQVNFLLQRQPGIKPEQAQEAGKKALEFLVSEQLAVQQAKELKLDRNPQVAQALEAAQREVLSRAYAEQIASKVTKPTAEEVSKFYSSNPALFKERKIYAITELAVKPEVGKSPAFQDAVKAATDVNDLVQRLRSQSMEFGVQPTNLPAESIPMQILPQLAAAPTGRPQLVNGPRGIQAMVINATRPAPVDEATAKPAIERLLSAERARKAVDENIAQLRKAAKIEYAGNFAVGSAPVINAGSAPNNSGAASAPLDALKGISGLK